MSACAMPASRATSRIVVCANPRLPTARRAAARMEPLRSLSIPGWSHQAGERMRGAQTGVVSRLLTLVLVLAACGAPPAATSSATPSEPVLTPIPRAEIIEGLPSQAAPPPGRPPQLEPPVVAVGRSDFPITAPSGVLTQGSVGEQAEA